MVDLYYNFSNIIFILLFAFLSFLISFSVARIYRKTSLWLSVKAVKLEIKNITIALSIIIACTVFVTALFYSGPLILLSGLPISILFVLIIMSLAYTPIIFGAILARYIFKNEFYIEAKTILYSIGYLLLLTVLPYYIGFIFIIILVLYTFGVVADYCYNVLISNKNML